MLWVFALCFWSRLYSIHTILRAPRIYDCVSISTFLPVSSIVRSKMFWLCSMRKLNWNEWKNRQLRLSTARKWPMAIYGFWFAAHFIFVHTKLFGISFALCLWFSCSFPSSSLSSHLYSNRWNNSETIANYLLSVHNWTKRTFVVRCSAKFMVSNSLLLSSCGKTRRRAALQLALFSLNMSNEHVVLPQHMHFVNFASLFRYELWRNFFCDFCPEEKNKSFFNQMTHCGSSSMPNINKTAQTSIMYSIIFHRHIPKAKATAIADTPELKRIAENTKIQSNVKYHADFEKNKGKLTQVRTLFFHLLLRSLPFVLHQFGERVRRRWWWQSIILLLGREKSGDFHSFFSRCCCCCVPYLGGRWSGNAANQAKFKDYFKCGVSRWPGEESCHGETARSSRSVRQ